MKQNAAFYVIFLMKYKMLYCIFYSIIKKKNTFRSDHMETGGRKDRSTFSVAIVAGDHMDTSLKRTSSAGRKSVVSATGAGRFPLVSGQFERGSLR